MANFISANKETVQILSENFSAKIRTTPNFLFEEFRIRNGKDIFIKSKNTELIWKISLSGPDGTTPEITNKNAIYKGFKILSNSKNKTEIKFDWEMVLTKNKSVIVSVVGKFSPDENLSYWNIYINLLPGWNVSKIDFPIIPNIIVDKNLKLAAPFGWGIERDMKPYMNYEGTYPSCLATMQFLALYKNCSGLYIATHDKNACLKTLKVSCGENKSVVSISHYPSVENKRKYSLPYEIAIGAFQGDYYEASQIYSKFTYQTPWGKNSEIKKRKIANWLKDTDLWIRPEGSPDDLQNITIQALKYFNCNTALHWYHWHKIPYDTHYPEYFPAKHGFKEIVEKIHKMGSHVMPYINGRLWDPSNKSWKNENGKDAAALKSDGTCYTEVYGSRVPNNAMCPYTKKWQDKIAAVVSQMFREYKTAGIYIDQISAAEGKLCYNPNHGHPLGGGSFWHEGYRKMLIQIKEKMDKDKIITSEENAECWIDLIDANLIVNTHAGDNIIPMFVAVYSGRTINFGFQYYPKIEDLNTMPFRAKLAQCFVFGSQMGWIQPQRIMDKKCRNTAQYLKDLSIIRNHCHDFLLYGKFLGMLKIEGDNPIIQIKGICLFDGKYEKEMPAVMGSAWLNENNEIGILLTNMTDEEYKITFRIPYEKTNININSKIAAEIYSRNECSQERVFNSKSLLLSVEKLSGLFIKLKNA